MDVDTALLRAFVVVAEERHFGRAAARLLVSQQAVSKRISRLESRLGTTLFDRTGGVVVVTDAGTRLLTPARKIVDDVDAALISVRPDSGPLHIDVLDEHLAPLRFVRDEARDRPERMIDVVMREHHADAVTTLRSGAADVVFGRAGAVALPWPDDIVRRFAVLEPLCLLIGTEHPWARRDDVRLSELRDEPLWFPMTGSPPEWRALLDELAADFSLTIDYGGSTMGFDHFLARAGRRGASFYGAAMPAPGPNVRALPIVDPVPVFPWAVMWRRRLPPASRAVVESVVGRARAGTAEPHPDDAWMPAADRALVTDPGQGRPRASRNNA